jgi:hypothetical protein
MKLNIEQGTFLYSFYDGCALSRLRFADHPYSYLAFCLAAPSIKAWVSTPEQLSAMI